MKACIFILCHQAVRKPMGIAAAVVRTDWLALNSMWVAPTVCKSLSLTATSFQGRGEERHNINTIKKYTESLTEAGIESDLAVNMEESQVSVDYLLQNAGQNHNIKTANRSFENVAQFKYLGMKVTNQNLSHEAIMSTLNLGNACYHSVWNLSSSLQLSKHRN
jgi:hypothetical protein